jgi:hypothetical protein
MGFVVPALTFINLTVTLQTNIAHPAPGWFGHEKPHKIFRSSEISWVYKLFYFLFWVFTLTSLIPVIFYIWAFKSAPLLADYPQWA